MYCMFIKIPECVSGTCISECFSLHVDQSLTKTYKKKKKNLNECVSWMCSRLYRTRFAHPSTAGVRLFLIFSLTLYQATYTRVSWMFCGQQRPVRFRWIVQFNQVLMWLSRRQSQEKTVTRLTQFQVTRGGRLQFGQTTLWSQKRLYDHNLSPLDVLLKPSTLLPHKPTQAISVSWFLWKCFWTCPSL